MAPQRSREQRRELCCISSYDHRQVSCLWCGCQKAPHNCGVPIGASPQKQGGTRMLALQSGLRSSVQQQVHLRVGVQLLPCIGRISNSMLMKANAWRWADNFPTPHHLSLAELGSQVQWCLATSSSFEQDCLWRCLE